MKGRRGGEGEGEGEERGKRGRGDAKTWFMLPGPGDAVVGGQTTMAYIS